MDNGHAVNEKGVRTSSMLDNGYAVKERVPVYVGHVINE